MAYSVDFCSVDLQLAGQVQVRDSFLQSVTSACQLFLPRESGKQPVQLLHVGVSIFRSKTALVDSVLMVINSIATPQNSILTSSERPVAHSQAAKTRKWPPQYTAETVINAEMVPPR